jgi:hypothetical protein
MQQRTTVRLVTSDPALFRNAAVALGAADYHILNDKAIDVSEPNLILRHWAETDWQPQQGPVPVLTLDLSLVAGENLVHVVERVLGRSSARDPGVDDLHDMLLEFESARYSRLDRSNPPRRTDN